MNEVVQKAFEIAKNDLRSCYTLYGIASGISRNREYHARNSFFASLGCTKIGDFGAVKKNLGLFLARQRKDGMVPVKVSWNLMPFHGFGQLWEPLDQNALLVMALTDYAMESGDKEFVANNFDKIISAVRWLERREKNGLLEEGLQCSWAYTILKFGHVLYTNCCYYKALLDFSGLCRIAGKNELSEKYLEKSGRVKEKINKMFWGGNFYSDWVDFSVHEYFACDGNVLGIVWGIADGEQAKMIENKIRQHRMNVFPLKTNYPPYPFWRVMWFLLPLHAYHYHNGASWPWLGAMNLLALKKLGWGQEARAELNTMADIIAGNGTVHEVLDNGKPFNSLLHKSEVHFSWNAGLFVKAVSETKNIDL